MLYGGIYLCMSVSYGLEDLVVIFRFGGELDKSVDLCEGCRRRLSGSLDDSFILLI